MDKTVRIWNHNSSDKHEVCCYQYHNEAVKDFQWNHDSTQIISGGFDKMVNRVDLTTGKLLKEYKHKEYVTAIKYHPHTSNTFLVGGFKNGVVCWDIRCEKVVSQYQGQFGQVQSIEFINNGTEFLTCSDITKRNSLDKAILVWDWRTGALLSNQVYQEAFTITSLKSHPNGSSFLAQSNGNYIAIFSTKKPYKLNKYKRFEGHLVSGYNLEFDISPDGFIVCTGTADGKIFYYSWNTAKAIKTLQAHSQVCMDVSFHPTHSSLLASCSWDSSIKLWE